MWGPNAIDVELFLDIFFLCFATVCRMFVFDFYTVMFVEKLDALFGNDWILNCQTFDAQNGGKASLFLMDLCCTSLTLYLLITLWLRQSTYYGKALVLIVNINVTLMECSNYRFLTDDVTEPSSRRWMGYWENMAHVAACRCLEDKGLFFV